MRKLLFIFVSVLLTASVYAQSPEKMSYQAVIRNNSNDLVTGTQVGMQISILQGTADGTAVYTETQTPTTNANGLVSVKIGGEVGFNAIDWSNGPYFIKTETDPTGGDTYTIIGTSQLLTVPYALHAKTAESISTGSGSHYVGELYGGGVVFWVDHTGQHGLIVSMIDLSSSQDWSNITDGLIGTTNDWNGANNTTSITEQSGHISSAAKLCEDYTNSDYSTGTYSDWYLPSIAELNHVWNNFYEVQKNLTNDGNSSTTSLVKDYYWSSTEYSSNGAWCFSNSEGYAGASGKDFTAYVRAIRSF